LKFKKKYNFIKGCAFEKKGDNERSIKDFTLVLDLDSSHVNAVFARAACYNKMGDFNLAIEDYNKALELDQEKQ